MRSIKDTLKTIRDIINALPDNVAIALVGGYAAILHGVERTTLDVDFCLYTDLIQEQNSTAFYDLLKQYLPKRFVPTLLQGSRFPDDPFQHDVIFLEDSEGEYVRFDLLIVRYKWELEGIKLAEMVKDIPIPVMTKPYLAAMKLRASGFKDANDVAELVSLMTLEEKTKTQELAKRIGRDKKLAWILEPPESIRETEAALDERNELL